VLHVDNTFTNEIGIASTAAFYSTEAAAVQKFLEKETVGFDSSFIRIIEWRPSLNYYKEAYVKLLSAAVNFIKRADAEKRTAAFFGRRWIKNFFKNLKNIENILLYKTTDIPVIVTGSGPSLESVLPFIKEFQSSALIIASSSSIMALVNSGIDADIVIATDGGIWALNHIYTYYRKEKTTAFAVNLCAALPCQCKETPKLLINDGSFWQNIIYNKLFLPSVIIPQSGTVTASAVELAMILSSGIIYLAGIDLSINDIRTHVRPYSFDILAFESSNRFAPVYSQNFTRSNLLKNGGSMNIYAAWFRNQLEIWPKRIFSLNDSRIFNYSYIEKSQRNKNTKKYLKPVKIKKKPTSFYKNGVSALIRAISESEYTESLKGELVPLLFPEKKDITETELISAITEIASYYEKG
jgi:hypothetical protein